MRECIARGTQEPDACFTWEALTEIQEHIAQAMLHREMEFPSKATQASMEGYIAKAI